MKQIDNLWTIKEIASDLRVSKQPLYRMVRSRTIPAYKVGRT